VKVRYDEGIANHIGAEPCTAGREARGEASAGECTGQPLSRDRIIPDADAVPIAEGNMDGCASASARSIRRGQRPWHVRTLFVRKPGDPTSDQAARRTGPHREGEEP